MWNAYYRTAKLFTFSGSSRKECEDFIQNVRRYAFSQGKLKDKEWVALFASTCFSGRALRWYARLDDPTKESWDLLQTALLEEWPDSDSPPPKPSGIRDTSVYIPSTASIITSPAALPPSLITKGGNKRPLISSSQPASTRRGRVQVHTKGVADPGYLKFMSGNGRFHASFTTQRDSADHFELNGKQLSFLTAKKKLLLTITWPRGFPTEWGWIKAIETQTESRYANIWEVGPDNNLFVAPDGHKLAISSALANMPLLRGPTIMDMTGLIIYADFDDYVNEFGVPTSEFLLTLKFEDA
ncbi:hypothetical protein FRB99_001924 [Tulasnella sp. 403]|nr:hypothetical protein FRB99_001924 [Tulasnella sp. 403]